MEDDFCQNHEDNKDEENFKKPNKIDKKINKKSRSEASQGVSSQIPAAPGPQFHNAEVVCPKRDLYLKSLVDHQRSPDPLDSVCPDDFSRFLIWARSSNLSISSTE